VTSYDNPFAHDGVFDDRIELPDRAGISAPFVDDDGNISSRPWAVRDHVGNGAGIISKIAIGIATVLIRGAAVENQSAAVINMQRIRDAGRRKVDRDDS